MKPAARLLCLGLVPMLVIGATRIIWQPVLVTNEGNQMVGALIGSAMAVLGLAIGAGCLRALDHFATR